MDHGSWWKRGSREKSSGESESSGSVSSFSEKFSNELEAIRAPNHAQSPEGSSIDDVKDVYETLKVLTRKPSATLPDVTVKEDLVKLHTEVAEEAVLGWEVAKAEAAALKQQLEASLHKNATLEDRVSQLDEALKECVRQLRQSREKQEHKLQEAIINMTHEFGSQKTEFEKQLDELPAQSGDNCLQSRLQSVEKENGFLKSELLAQSEKLNLQKLEIEICNQAAESASKQHLQSIKKIAKLESECRRLQAVTRKTCSPLDHFDSMEVLPSVDNSWASALIAELDHFKHGKASERDLTASSLEIDLMDDFLEMERLVAQPEASYGTSNNYLKADSTADSVSDKSLRFEHEALHIQPSELQKKVEKMEYEKAQLEMSLAEAQNQLILAADKLIDLENQLCLADESKQAAVAEAVALHEQRNELECQRVMASSAVTTLKEKLYFLQEKLEKRTSSAEFEGKVETLEAIRKELQSQLDSAQLQTDQLRELVSLLEGKLEEERTLSAEYSAKAEGTEMARKDLEIQLTSVDSELEKLNKLIALLEQELDEERLLSGKLAARAETAEAARNSLVSQLELTHSECARLSDKILHLEDEVEKERILSAEFPAKYRILEEELSRMKEEGQVWRATGSNGEVKLGKEKEKVLAVAAVGLAECQKTIASLSQQLRSLTCIDGFLLETEKSEDSGG
ncbi:Filament-like plant protein 3 [Apostasia shenzhenica]|uniref:Filament-like plant protein 3 n=1 Tax=Apostasia shenzhenica TaxID=1088818 RepID=A0A2I0AP81_9ASPA|nr:Filament-like plant protein 3 [Apostasia shenzhenica]